MKYIAIGLGAASLICGLISRPRAFWYQASRIPFEPNYSELADDHTELDFHWALMRAIMTAVQKTSALNRLAALWSAAAVALSGAASLMGPNFATGDLDIHEGIFGTCLTRPIARSDFGRAKDCH